jgi:nucleotide-binding universal stress UspA family protein
MRDNDIGLETKRRRPMSKGAGGSSIGEPVPPRIVVGVDGSSTSLGALDWAVREARLRGATLQVVHATFFRQAALDLESFAEQRDRERAILDEAVAKASALAPHVTVTGLLCDPPAAKALVDISADAELLVVGSRGLGPFREFTLGSVSQDCARHAQCPLVIFGAATSEKALAATHA